ncbi:MAG: sigma 54-interacting transcriptional regulator [Sandaracinaceae bacterium]|nr:sigma 54-interacting transcriptional regulator [Sandaracinaceae bacterium]
MEALGRELVDVVVTDLHLPGMSGLELLKRVAGEEAPPVIVVTGDTDLGTAVDAMRAGAADYVNKPLTMKALEHVLERVVETTRLRRRVSLLQREVEVDPDPVSSAVSPTMKATVELARRSATTETAVLLVGESGVGKEVIAAHVHRLSARASGPFVRINVAAIPDTMIEAELFGAVRGAFTDARQDRAGFFAAADRGTLLLDEIAELSRSCRRSCCASSRRAASIRSARAARRTPTCGSSRPPTAIPSVRWRPAACAPTSSTGWPPWSSACRRCASAWTTSDRSRAPCSLVLGASGGAGPRASTTQPSWPWSSTPGPATCGSSATWWSAPRS